MTDNTVETKTLVIPINDKVSIEMVLIPKGSFIMGAPEDEEGSYDDERPQHEVNLEEFYIGKFEVTQEQYEAVMGINPSYFKGEKRPVERVSWYDAMEFCKKLSEITGYEFDLPSEAQWEYACRAGTTTPFNTGETITTDQANFDGRYSYNGSPEGIFRGETTDVGTFPPNKWGLHDMHGNVYEWCKDDWHPNYEGAPTDGSAWID